MFETFFLIIIITIIVTYLIYRSNENRQIEYFTNKNLPVLKSFSLITAIRHILSKNAAEIVKIMYDRNENDRLFGFYNNGKPTLFLRDPVLIKQFAIKNFDHFTDHHLMMFMKSKFDPHFAKTLFAMKGQKWRDMRSALSPEFTGSKMRQMFELMNGCGEQMGQFFMEQCRRDGPQSYDMKDIYLKFTIDVIVTCIFGLKCDSLRDPQNDFLRIGKQMMKFQKPSKLLKVLIARMLPDRIAGKLFDMKFIDDTTRLNFSEIIVNTMKTRKEKNIYRPDMINLLMELKKGQLKTTKYIEKNERILKADDHRKHATGLERTWSDDDLISQSSIFFLAGFDTTSTLMTFMSYELAVNPNIQAKLQDEIDKVDFELLGKPVTYDRVQSMTYLDMVITESLRKWPPVNLTDRLCVKDFACENDSKISIEKGGSLWIPIFGIHRDPKYFPEPDTFDPERFNKENKSKIDLNNYLPFGIGPRNCISSRFALMAAKVIFYYLLRDFTFEVCQKTQVPLKLKKRLAVMIPENIFLTLKPRRQ